MSKADEILSILGQMEVLILKAKEIAGTPGNAPVAAPEPRRAASAPPPVSRPSPAVQKVQAAFQGGADFPAVGTVVDLPEPVTIAHKDGPLGGIRQAKIHFPGNGQPCIGPKDAPRAYFHPDRQPAWWQEKFCQYDGWTWQELFAEPSGAGLDAILSDKFWTVFAPQKGPMAGKRSPAKIWEQAMALKVLRGEREPGADENEAPAGDGLDF